MPDSTSALINQLTNPPNPFERFGATVDFANKYKQFQADKAAADAYQQSVDPTTGAFDMGKFNALTSQGPGAWHLGAAMQQAGQGYGAQGLAAQAQTDAARGQLTLLNGYLAPLLEKVNNGEAVTADEVRSVMANAYGLSPQTLQGVETRLANLAPGQVNGALRGFSFAAQSAEGQAARTSPTIGQNIELAQTLWTPKDYPDPADPTQMKHGTVGSYLIDTGGDPNGTIRRMMSGGYAPGAGGPSVGASGGGAAGGGKGGGVSGGKGGAPGPQSSAAPAGAFDTGDPDLNLIAKYESNYKPMAGWGGAKDVDLSGYPLTATGFPDWKGNPGPQGNSTAAGLFQIEKSTWDPIAKELGIHDFSIPSQIAVAKELKARNGLSDWLPYNPQLAAAYARGERVSFPGGGGQQGAAAGGAKPVQVASLPPTTATDATVNPYAGTGGQGTYVPPGGIAPRNVATGQPVPSAGVVPQPPGPGQPTNINQPTPPVGAPGPALTAGGGAQLSTPPVRLASNFPIGGGYSTPTTLPITTETSGKKYTADLEQYDALPQRISPLTQAAGILKANPNLGTGTGAEDVQKLASLAQTFGFTLSPQANSNLTAFTELNKDLERYYLSKPGSSRSDLAQTETKMSQPSTTMQREALEDLVARTIGLERANSAPLVNFQQQHGVGNAANYAPQYQAEAAAYRNTLDPVAFGFDYMTPQQRRTYWNSLDDNGKARYEQSIKEASRLFGIGIPRQ